MDPTNLFPLISSHRLSDCSIFADNSYSTLIPQIQSCSFQSRSDFRWIPKQSPFFTSSSNVYSSLTRNQDAASSETALKVIPSDDSPFNELFVRVRQVFLGFQMFDRSDALSETNTLYSVFGDLSQVNDFSDPVALAK